MAALDVVVNCNRLGSIGRQAFETMAVSTLCIATHKKPKTSKIIVNQKSGYIVKEGDIEEIRKIIIVNYNDRSLMSQITNQGYLDAKKGFSNHLQTRKIEAYYQKLINAKNE
jgi:glycosyltransferase involved in cell wall biosynthesis